MDEAEETAAIPPWKAEFMERKRKKAKRDEVPQWKRELLKRIQSKNQRMIEEQQQADILEEHIPKISDNIFLIHQKKVQHRFPPVSPSKAVVPPTATVTLSVDNVIIIEKENEVIADEINSASSSDSVFGANEVEKEYPKAGIVHRLLGRFQVDKPALPPPPVKKTQFNAAVCEHPKACETVKPATPCPLTPPPTPNSTPIKEKPDLDITSTEFQSLTTSTMPSGLISPLLMSSAKPFLRQDVTNASGEHGFHHVSAPVRRVTAPTSPKYTTPVASDQDLPEEGPESSSSSFPEGLSSLHSSTEMPADSSAAETVVVESKASEGTVVSKPRNLRNGDTLHSGGSELQRPSISPRRPTKLQDKGNFSSYHSASFADSKKVENISPNATNDESPKKESFVIPKKPEIMKASKPKPELKARPLRTKENREGYFSNSRTREHSENQFRSVVTESFDESTLKSQAAVAANHIMKTSKTFKITPSGQKGQSFSATPAAHKPTSVVASKSQAAPTTPGTQELNSAPVSAPDCTTSVTETVADRTVPQLTPPIPLRRHEVEKAETTVLQAGTSTSPTPEGPPVQSSEDLPVISIEGDVNMPEIMPITPMPSLSVSSITETGAITNPVVKPAPAKIPSPSKEEKPQNSFASSTSSNAVSVVPKSELVQKQSIFGPKVAKSSSSSSRGKSFTIDPSRFRKSSAQPPTVSSGSSTIQGSGNTRIIIPGSRKFDATETDSAGDTTKTGKRKLTVDQIIVIGGYVTLEKSCLVKEENKRKKCATISFSEKDLETTYSYVSERSLTDDANLPAETKKSPGSAKDSTIGKYTPKYLLSMKATEIPDDDEDCSESSKTPSISTQNGFDSSASTPNEAAPLPEGGTLWGGITSSSSDIPF